MPTTMCIYSETLENGEWIADQASTFRTQETGHQMACISCPADYLLYNLLADGARPTSQECRWNFKARGLPSDVSPEVQLVAQTEFLVMHHASYLGLDELMDKSMTLLVDASGPAWQAQSQLLLLIRKLITANPAEVPYEQRRIVFWFRH
jgi:hypothetical protein